MTATRTYAVNTVKGKTIATIAAIAAAVAIPQLFHFMGAVSGTGTLAGETFLPMHIAVLAVGFIGGGVVGGITGFIAPLLSFALTGMPGAAMLPFMMIELAAYGALTGLLSKTKLPVIASLLIAQICGRAVRAAAILLGFYAFGSAVEPATIWTSVVAGLPGLALQWALIPLFVYWVKNLADKRSNDR